MFKLDLEKAEEPDQITNICWITEKAREFQKNICFIDYSQAFYCVEQNKLRKILKEIGIAEHVTCFRRNLYAGQKVTESDMEQRTSSKLGKKYIKAVYGHPAYLTYMQCTSCKMLGWIKHNLELRLQREISITSDMQMASPLWQKVKRN